MTLSVIIRPEAEEGGYIAECPELPGCLSQGETIEEALANAREAAVGILQSMRDHGDALPTGDMIIATMSIEVAA